MCRSQVLPTIVATGRERLGEHAQRDVLVGASAAAARHAERCDLRARRRVGLERAEQLGVLRVRLREARLDEREAHADRSGGRARTCSPTESEMPSRCAPSRSVVS